ncbi:MAG: class I SAM-dependent methyltransferase [Prolixibacteraceae bacterium]|nr:class I SAM-dependent methyltransferase [Prolixibacteraceae bacterium]
MPIHYKNIVPWGRSYSEYVNMFALEPGFLSCKILGCGDGPAAFNAVGNAFGGEIVSVDPLFRFSKPEIEKRIDETFGQVMAQTRENAGKFNWDVYGSVEGLGKIRMKSMRQFLSDYEKGLEEGRYIDAELPFLPFGDDSFDLALCSHFLMLYSDHLNLDFHLKAIDEMLRVAAEVRIFPVLEMNANRSAHLGPIMERFPESELITVNYEFQKGGNQMLKITKE